MSETIVKDAAVPGLRSEALRCLEERGLERKISASLATHARWLDGSLRLDCGDTVSRDRVNVAPGLPASLCLTSPKKVARRGFGSSSGLAAFVHAITHIEWNAINLAWDAVWRFDGMPREYYDDWASVAADEARHFAMLRARLLELGSDYGALPAHDGLWESAQATRHDLLARMALVPRVLEARGLDVTPDLIVALRRHGDEATAAILEVVLREEVRHVRIGSHWFHWLCEQRGLAPAEAFEACVREYFRGRTRAIASPEARRLRVEAGFRDDELEAIERLAKLAGGGGASGLP